MRHNLMPGYNVDYVDVDAGLRELAACGYDHRETKMTIAYALTRWARGEEEGAIKTATNKDLNGVSLTCWYRIIAAAVAEGNARKRRIAV